ncbi:GAF domain-containing protein [Caballeronia sp. GAWG1-1]|uniref:GAF domain-containing protein n=1 Tax=Caballeronia sp. GAWG1-1 TaxID=2921742 RepID=UPI00202943C3|nr:GAF domain-containing protein [Caballeronia sp. GAWG1-1]
MSKLLILPNPVVQFALFLASHYSEYSTEALRSSEAMESDPILTTRQAAEILGVSVRTVQTWVEEGAIESWKTPGGHRRVRKSAVAALRARRVVAPTQTLHTVLVIASEAAAKRCSESIADLHAIRVAVVHDALFGLIEAGHQTPSALVLEVDRLDWERIALLKRLLASPRLSDSRVVVLSTLTPEEFKFDLGDAQIRVVSKHASNDELRAAIAPHYKAATNKALTQEHARLQALARTHLVDSPRQEEFDAIVTMAASVLKAPIALITLLTAEKQWFKARFGLDVQETPRANAFCNYTIEQQDVFVVEDAALDERFSANPLVTGDPRIRFYAGAPIIDYEGFPLGALCVIDRDPRRFKTSQVTTLRTLAALLADKINLHARDRQLRWAKSG